MDLKMLLLKFGLIVLFYFPTVQLAKDTMEFSDFTFTWEDAEARCNRQGQILVPGRRYRAKLLKRWMEQKNVQSIWLNGWRSVSDTIPDADGKLRTLKVDFSRPHNKDIKLVCKIDSVFYDPFYVAKSKEDAQNICERDGAVLVDIETEEDVKKITEAILVDKPNWVNSISSQASKIKQCLIAERVGDELKYSYVDCSKEYSFICITDKNLIASFSPLISLKMARYDEFEEEIEKHKQDMSSSFDLFESVSSTDVFLEMSSTEIMTTTEVSFTTYSKTLNQTTTVIQLPDILTSKPPALTSSESTADFMTSKVPAESTTERTPSIKPTEKYSEVTTSEMHVYVTKKDIDIDMPTSGDVTKITSSEKPPMSISFTTHVMETSIPEIIVSSKSSVMVDSAGVPSPSETFPEAIITDVDINLYVTSSSSDQDSFTITPSETLLPVLDSSIVDKTDSELLPKSQVVTQSYNLYHTSSSHTMLPQSSFYTDMTIDAKSPYVDVIVTDPLPTQTGTATVSPSSTTDMKQPSTDDYYYGNDTYDYEDETGTSSPLPGLETSETTPHTTETKPVVIVTPIVSEKPTSEYIDIYSDVSKAIETQTSPTSSVSSVHVDIPSSVPPSEKDILLPSEPTATSFECTVIDATSYCPDTTSTTATFDSSSHTQTTKSQTDKMMETTFSSPPPSIDIDGESSQPSSATLTADVTPSMYEFDYDDEYPDKDDDKYSVSYISTTPKTVVTPEYDAYESYEIDDADDKESETSEPYMTMSTTPNTTVDYDDLYESYEYDDDEYHDITENVDSEITGEIDIDETEDYNEAGNESGDTGEVVGKKAEDEEEGMEVGLWVAFGILILLVLVALILALYLYRRRKMQKSKDISATNGSAAAGASSGETVELRDSRSPSRENGQPRESTTFKDPAYDI